MRLLWTVASYIGGKLYQGTVGYLWGFGVDTGSDLVLDDGYFDDNGRLRIEH